MIDAFGVDRTDISKGLPSYIRQAVYATPEAKNIIKNPSRYNTRALGRYEQHAVETFGEQVPLNTKKYPEVRARQLKLWNKPDRIVVDSEYITRDISRRAVQHLKGKVRSSEISANRSDNNGNKLVLRSIKKRPLRNI